MTTQTEDQQPKVYPPWRYALEVLEQGGIEPGSVIEKDRLIELFGIPQPKNMAEFQKNTHLFRFFVWQLRSELMKKHRLVIRSLNGIGYEVLEPRHQTSRVMRDRGEAINRELLKLADEISYVRLEALDDSQRKANLDAQAKVGALMSMTRKKLGFAGAGAAETEID
jgi:hypothetical protein